MSISCFVFSSYKYAASAASRGGGGTQKEADTSLYRKMTRLLLVLLVMLGCFCRTSFSAAFHELFESSWALDHLVYDGEILQLKLDNVSGAGFVSKSSYLFGKASAQIKLVPGDSAGTVTAFYMSSEGPLHDEFDFEFLGNTSGEPYLVQTNVYSNGTGDREQRFYLWFDPTADFHNYTFVWNKKILMFMVDEVPVRVFVNREEEKGVAYPQRHPMKILSSIWNADDWATQGGLVKTNWSHAPFVSTYRAFDVDANDCFDFSCSAAAWWNSSVSSLSVSAEQRRLLRWVHKSYMIYDYCKDSSRFPNASPPECLDDF